MPVPEPVVIIACAVLKDVLSRAKDPNLPVIYTDYGLHLTPQRMRSEIQARIDALQSPHRILIGFGLCGNGLVGLKARQHTLIIPRVDDCVSLFLGSRDAYLLAFQAEPGTYYLTPGWLECGGEPWTEYHNCLAKFGPEKAALITDALYQRYRKVCFIALTTEDLEKYRPRALMVAEFCRQRWGWQYHESMGSDALIKRMLDFAHTRNPLDASPATGEFVIIPPGGEVQMEQFMENQYADSGSDTNGAKIKG